MNAHQTPSPQVHMRGVARIGICLAIAALAIVAWNVISARRAAAELVKNTDAAAIISVAVTHPESEAAGAGLVLPGTVQANLDAPIYARTNGYLKRWLVDIGTRVKAGQLLAEIDTPEVEQQLQQAEADVATAKANAHIADITADRWQQLRRTDSVSQQDTDERISLAASSKAQLDSAEANLRRLHDLSSFQRIVAPFDGVITARETDVGRLIVAGGNTGPELFRIADERRLRLYVRVPQSLATAMTAKTTAQVAFPDHPGSLFQARLDSTASAIDPATNTLLVQLIVDNSNGELLPGAYAEVHFTLPAATGGSESLKLPANTLLFRSDGTRVATVDRDNHVKLKTVVIGRDYGSAFEVVHGLSPQDTVILSPSDSLTDDVVVRVVKPATGSAPPAGKAGT